MTTLPFFDGPDLGRALRLLREHAGLTQQEVIDAMNVERPDDRRVHRTTLIRWEQRGRIYFPDLVQLLATLDAGARARHSDLAEADAPEPDQRTVDLLLLLVARLDRLQESSVDKVDRLRETVERRFEKLDRQLAELRRSAGS